MGLCGSFSCIVELGKFYDCISSFSCLTIEGELECSLGRGRLWAWGSIGRGCGIERASERPFDLVLTLIEWLWPLEKEPRTIRRDAALWSSEIRAMERDMEVGTISIVNSEFSVGKSVFPRESIAFFFSSIPVEMKTNWILLTCSVVVLSIYVISFSFLNKYVWKSRKLLFSASNMATLL